VVPEAQYFETLRFNIACSVCIIRHTLGVLTTIGLNDQMFFQAHEVGNVRADGNLTAELVPGESTIS
jgi:hypothetical protein